MKNLQAIAGPERGNDDEGVCAFSLANACADEQIILQNGFNMTVFILSMFLSVDVEAVELVSSG